MNVFIIISILVIIIGIIFLIASPSTLFKMNWNKKNVKEKTLMFIFYSILVYLINLIFWVIN